MKRSMLFKTSILSLLVVVLLTGCGSKKDGKTLTCTLTSDMGMFEMHQTVESVFDSKGVTDINQTIKMTVTDTYKAYIDSMADGVRNQYADIKDKDGIEFKVTVNGNVITTILNAKLSKLDDTTKSKLSVSGSTATTYEAGKKSLEAAGYTCK